MNEIVDQATLHTLYQRWAYMLIAILASALLFIHPVFNFQDDKGIIYVRSFSMDQTTFYVTHTEIDTGIAHVTDTTPVTMLYYCNKVMFWGCILCFLCFFSYRIRIALTYIMAFVSGGYYILMVYYAMLLSDLHFTTLYPNFMAVLPGIVCLMMVLTGRNVIRERVDRVDEALETYEVN